MIDVRYLTDEEGNPLGGYSIAKGISVIWQNGALVNSQGERLEQNGAFVEDLIHVAKDRIEYYQSLKFKCQENQEAIEHLEKALEALQKRTSRRKEKGIEGTHETD